MDVNDPDHVIVPIYLREKKSSLSYSPSNLFGQPQLISLPKNNLTYETLYNHLLKRLQRYVNPPPPGQLWWKSNANNNNNVNHINHNINESMMNGETNKIVDDNTDGLASSKELNDPQTTTINGTSTSKPENGESLDGSSGTQVWKIAVDSMVDFNINFIHP